MLGFDRFKNDYNQDHNQEGKAIQTGQKHEMCLVHSKLNFSQNPHFLCVFVP